MCLLADTIDHCIGNIGSHKADGRPVRSVWIGEAGRPEDGDLAVRIDAEARSATSCIGVGAVFGQSAFMTLIIILTIQIFSVETVPPVIDRRLAAGELFNDFRLEDPVSCIEPVL